MNTLKTVYTYLNTKGWVLLDDLDEQVFLLSQSRYNANYHIIAPELYGESNSVFRVSLESRLGLADQAEYEFTVVQSLRRSGVTPRPYYFDGNPGEGLGQGVMLMEYLPGQALEYGRDWRAAATVLAIIHAQPVDARLIEKSCAGMTDDPSVITHGPFTAADFIVDEDDPNRAWLVDWEYGMISSRWRDIALFMSAAADGGETGFCRDEAERSEFVGAYVAASGLSLSVEDALHRVASFNAASNR